MKKTIKIFGITALAVFVSAAAFIWSGLYPVGADVAHNRATFWLLETLRERSIARTSRGMVAPRLDHAGMLLAGGTDYNNMCASSHLQPGKVESDLNIGLYPKPLNPTLPGNADGDEAMQCFWVIKHGIKAPPACRPGDQLMKMSASGP